MGLIFNRGSEDENEEKSEVKYGSESFSETQKEELVTAEVEYSGKKEQIKGVFNTLRAGRERRDALAITDVQIGDGRIRKNKPYVGLDHKIIRSIDLEKVESIKVLKRKKIILEAEYEVNYKEEDGEKEYTSFRNIEKSRDVVE